MDLMFKLVNFACLLFSLSVHEAAHAAMGNRCGDPTARLLGRMTLNPIKHIDPIGTVVMPLLMLFSGIPFLFGWAKPVPFNPRNLNNFQRDPMLIALAGPASNGCIAITAAMLMRIVAVLMGYFPENPVFYIALMILLYLTGINLILMLFNMIPVPPLDGHHILGYFLPLHAKETLERIGPFGIVIAIILVNRTSIISVPMDFLQKMLHFVAFYGTDLQDIFLI